MDDLQTYVVLPGHSRDPIYPPLGDPVAPDRLGTRLGPGAIVVLRPPPHLAWPDLAIATEHIAARVADADFGLWPDRLDPETAMRCAAKARLLGVRAVLHDRVPDPHRLRADLTDPTDWPAVVALWVRRRRGRPAPEADRLLHLLAAEAIAHRRLGTLMARHGPSRARWRRAFDTDGLGAPAAWHTALRVVGMALHVQRHPRTTLDEAAFQLGLSGPGPLADRFRAVLGASPSTVRAHPGGPWLLDAAVQRLGLL